MSEKIEDIEARIKELEQVKISLKEKQLSEARKAERLKLLDHPFVKALRNVLREANYMSTEEARKKAYQQIDKSKLEALEDLHKKVTWVLKSAGETITEKQLTDMITKIFKENEKIEREKTGVV
jgi:hemoglobin-like flavoprotein